MAKTKQRKQFTIFDIITLRNKRQFKVQVADFEDFSVTHKEEKEARRRLIDLIFNNLKDYTNDVWMAQSYDYGEGQERLWCFAQSNDPIYFIAEWYH